MLPEGEIVNDDILFCKDVYYSGSTQEFVKMPDTSLKLISIETPVLYVDNLHSCYSHMIESILHFHWVIKVLEEKNYIPTKDITIFIQKENLLKYRNFHKNIDDEKKCYTGAWNDLPKVVTKRPVLFEHWVEKDTLFYFPTMFVLEFPYYQYSFWNTHLYYPARELPPEYKYFHLHTYKIQKDNDESLVRFSDEKIREELLAFRTSVLQMYMQEYDVRKSERKQAILINRKVGRLFEQKQMDALTMYLKQISGIEFKGIFVLEDLPFGEQVQLFNTTDIFVMKHGSAPTNMIWAKPGSILIELDEYTGRTTIFQRLCSFLDQTCCYLPLSSIDTEEGLLNFKEILTNFLR